MSAHNRQTDVEQLEDEYKKIVEIGFSRVLSSYVKKFFITDVGAQPWVARMTYMLLIKTCTELLEELRGRVAKKIQGTPKSNREDRIKLDTLRVEIDEALDSIERIYKEDNDSLFHLEGPPPNGFDMRKEAVPFYYYHDKKYEKDGQLDTTPRRFNNLLFDAAERKEDMRRRPLVFVDRATGRFLRYIITEENYKPEEPGGEEYTYIRFVLDDYRQCAFCGVNCTKLLHKCGGCKCISYCCKEHQVADRVNHTKEVCRAMRLEREASR